MKKQLKKLVLILVAAPMFTMTAQTKPSDAKAAIEAVLVESYVEGVFRKFNEKAIRDGFHKDFQFHAPMMSPQGRTLKKFDLDTWVNMLKNMKFENIEYKLLDVNVTDDAAVTVNEIYQDGKKLYTDYMVWQNLDGKWKIMGKVFAYHQKRMRRPQ
ncbi:nuclear transport factor 2 family protein [Leptobacterium sp. I13]|uniref:nuclear transport factor 2 family protein n=1 Tax=Leptobacterium meishanense TaxID=3128904 RepID=UPI0030EB77D7